jgi:outer membrane protein TolC
MKHLLLASVLVMIFVMPGAPGVVAQTPSPPPRDATLSLTLEEAIRRGLDTSHQIEASMARSEMVTAVADQRLAALRPLAALEAGYTRTNHVDEFGVVRPNNEFVVIYPDIPDNYRTRVGAQWLLYDGHRRESLERSARSDARVASQDTDVLRQDLRLEITRAYWALVMAIESSRVLNESLTRVEAQLQDVRNQLEAGLIPPNDVLSVEAQRSRQQMLSIQASATRDVAQAALGRLIGVPPGTAVEPRIPDTLVPEAGAIDVLVAEARQNRRERNSLIEGITAAEERQRAAAAGSGPTIAANGGVDYANPNPRIFPRAGVWQPAWDASINLNWPLFDGGRTKAEVAEAAAGVRAARARLAEFDTILEVEVRQRWSELGAARAAIVAAEDAVRAATEARRVAGERFAAGVATSTDTLDAQVALLQAGLDRTQAIANARLAQARLARAVGR